MTVDKMELLKRYKELKAQGVSITLMELKKQMESEGLSQAVNISETSQVAVSPGVSCHPELVSGSVNAGSTSTTAGFGGVNAAAPSPLVEEDRGEGDAQNQVSSSPLLGRGQGGGSAMYTSAQTDSAPAFVSSFNSESQPTVSTFSQPIQPQVETIENHSYQQQFQPVNPASAFMPSATENNFVQTPLPQPQVLQPTSVSLYSGNVAENNVQPVSSDSKNKKFALIGYPLGHSLSAFIHDAGFKSLGENYTYEILETAPESLVDRIKYLKFNGYSGFNVTIPLKLPVTMFLDEIDVSADVIGAVNTVVINPDKTMKGYNTDVIGFRKAIPDDFTLPGKVAGVLGTGGAARAAITALAQSQVKEIKIYTRNIPNSLELLKFLRSKFPNVEFNVYQIERIRDLSEVQILVNATPIGMQGRAADLTPVEEPELRTLPQGALVYDVIYNPKKTMLLKLAQKNGYRTINGIDMFIYQALVAEQIWTGRVPDFKDMKIAALENL
ncbi:MAG: shikimate dehydrogenase [Muribaculaceae bacterium]|nr:shikimate dehydrogenase [Muribaculaceae bacterium]